MVDSGDSDLIHQKLTMSQYLAYKSEPMGPELGDSASFRERVFEKLYTSSSSIVSFKFISICSLISVFKRRVFSHQAVKKVNQA